ncbi:MAG TPA: ABC transporter [Armatimonadetes bacterium]|nr:ABC transporter [Armatimonadota bacterium]
MAIEVRDVTFSYDGQPIVEDVNVTVPLLDLAAIVGPNGGGKTTLLKLMMGLLQPNTGEVRVFGQPPRAVAPRIGYVAQGFSYDRTMPITVLDVALMGRLGRARGRAAGEGKHSAVDALERVGMRDLADQPFAECSAGQQQRVLIARALVTEPDLLMLDEPTSALDVTAEREIYQLLSELNDHTTIVLVTHDLGFVSGVVKSVLCVNRFVRRHPTTEMGELTSEILEDLYGSDLRLVRHDRNEGTWCCRD